MANPTAHATGTSSQTSAGAEQIQSAPAVAGAFQFIVDLTLMAAGDVIYIRAYQIVLTGGTSRKTYFHGMYGAQPTESLVWVSIPLSNELTDANSLQFGIEQPFGTARALPWKVLKYT